MEYKELFEKYQLMIVENKKLKDENRILKFRLAELECNNAVNAVNAEVSKSKEESQMLSNEDTIEVITSNITIKSDTAEKIRLFMSIFKGRTDVYAKGWPNKKTGKYGYSPFCSNEWSPGLCSKPSGSCTNCLNKSFQSMNEKVIDNHLRGKTIVGIYPMCPDETCYFLAIDFDGTDWEKDVSAIREVCREFDIPAAVERSRSGEGGHMWFFFENKISAVLARKFGSALLTYSMNIRHELTFKSYDRLFPNQDTMPKGGFGNLIALPLQKAARSLNNSEFVDEKFKSYNDQWSFLASIKKLTEENVESLVSRLCQGNELGILKKDDEDTSKPWEITAVKVTGSEFPKRIEIVKANMLFIPKVGIGHKALNYLKRLAAFKNPEFYKAQAMRLAIKRNMSRIINCSDETEEYLCLPIGCEDEIKDLLKELKVEVQFIDRTNNGNKIDVEFNGELRDEQSVAVEKLLKHDIGVLSGTTAFGKTIVAIKMIVERKVNTLILVNKVSLVAQWKNRLMEFLNINEALSAEDENDKKKRGRKKDRSIIGQIGAGKDSPSGIIDIAVMQSLNRKGEVKDYVKNYGMLIIDECHHVSAFSFEEILKKNNSKYILGLTATPARKDGHHPIIFMQCGPIRYKDDAKKQAEKRPFEHYIIPRFTSLKVPIHKDEKDVSVQELYSEIVTNEIRNQLIVMDVINSYKNSRNCVVLTERTAHVENIAKMLKEKINDVICLTGGMNAKESRETMKQIADTPKDKPLVLVATGKYIGEGFDEPRLDTLFLAMPISWKGTLQQYAGRLHRLFETKKEVQIYDYVDIHVKMLEKMYNRRLYGYASIGYKAKGESIGNESINVIFDKSNFLPVYTNDLVNAKREIVIASPFTTKRRTVQMMQYLDIAIKNKVRVVVVTRPIEDFRNKDVVALQGVLDLLKDAGVSMVFKTNIHQKFAIIDEKIVWYGSINLLSFGSAEESVMRLESSNIASELIRSIGK
jgi:superfamily II DNA or RNA helicase